MKNFANKCWMALHYKILSLLIRYVERPRKTPNTARSKAKEWIFHLAFECFAAFTDILLLLLELPTVAKKTLSTARSKAKGWIFVFYIAGMSLLTVAIVVWTIWVGLSGLPPATIQLIKVACYVLLGIGCISGLIILLQQPTLDRKALNASLKSFWVATGVTIAIVGCVAIVGAWLFVLGFLAWTIVSGLYTMATTGDMPPSLIQLIKGCAYAPIELAGFAGLIAIWQLHKAKRIRMWAAIATTVLIVVVTFGAVHWCQTGTGAISVGDSDD
jgi:hypothetical protein